MPRVHRIAGCVVLFVFSMACRGSATTLPGWDTPNPSAGGEPTASADASASGAGDDDEAVLASADGTASRPPVPTEAGATNAPADDAADRADSSEASTSASASSKPLPKPLHAKPNPSCGKDSGIGQRLKPFKLATPDGKTVSPSTYRGRVLLVNFWGTWCKPCLQELPEFDQLYRRYRSHGLTLVAIATDEDAGAVRDFVARRKLAARVLIGGESYANQYSSDRFPFTFVVDPDGVIKASYRGYKPECAGQLESDLRAELERRNR